MAGSAMRRLETRLYSAALHDDAALAATAATVPWDLASFDGHKYCLVVTYRRAGTPVMTPVWFGATERCLYFRTDASSGKVKRIRHTPRVRIGPCTPRGRPVGPLADGVARVLDETGAVAAERALRNNYGLGRRIYERLFAASDAVYIQVEAL